MSLFHKLKEPVFLKQSSNAEIQLYKLKRLETLLNEDGQSKIRQDIKNLEYGIIGEKNITFELKNSHMPMYILHDIYLEDGELNTQIDYLVFTRRICFVIECKNLYGDIEINNSENFIRIINFHTKKIKEGIYSPIIQNERHLAMMKKLTADRKGNFLSKLIPERNYEYQTVVVLANPKTVLDAKFAKKEDKEKVIRADQLVKYIKDRYNQSEVSGLSDDKMLSLAQSYMNLHKEVEKNYLNRYEVYKIDDNKKEAKIVPTFNEVAATIVSGNVEDSAIFKELKAFRLSKSREENIKPYFIYNDNQLKDLILKMPKSKAELLKVAGFSEAKVNKYGNEILEIVKKY